MTGIGYVLVDDDDRSICALRDMPALAGSAARPMNNRASALAGLIAMRSAARARAIR